MAIREEFCEHAGLAMQINEDLIEQAMNKARSDNKKVLAIVLATKPCFNKLWTLAHEAKKANIPYFVIHTGQHYDNVLGFGLEEFNFNEVLAVDFRIRGDLTQKTIELFLKTKKLVNFLKERWVDVEVVPYVNGDTLTAGLFPVAWLFAANQKVMQGEAGLRSMGPKSFFDLKSSEDIPSFIEKQFNGEWVIMRNEPFPEQYDTFVSAAGSQFLFAPLEINKQHLLREGYPEDSIWVTGNTIVDALKFIKKKGKTQSVFNAFPELETDQWLRIDIHRRANLTERRFKSVISAIKKLVEKGYNINFIEMNATKKALNYFNLYDQLSKLNKEKANFLLTPVWQEYNQVIEFFESDHCWGVFTDSGSIQEEMNELGKTCLTARFNTDRPETVKDAHSNILVPPFGEDLIVNTIEHVYKNNDLRDQMSHAKKIYGSDVGKKTVDIIKELLDNEKYRTFKWAHEEYKLWNEKGIKLRYL